MGYISLTGNPITFTANRVNTISSLVLHGKTTQSGTGDPSPANIRPLSGAGRFDKKIVLNGSELWEYGGGTAPNQSDWYYVMENTIPDMPNIAAATIFSSNFVAPKVGIINNSTALGIGATWSKIRIRTSNKQSIADWRASLAANPITVYYQSTAYPTAAQYYTGLSVEDANGYHGIGIDLGSNQLYGDADVYDTYEPCVMVDGVLRSRRTQRYYFLALDGTENVWQNPTADPAKNRFIIIAPNVKPTESVTVLGHVLCSQYPTITAAQSYKGLRGIAISTNADGIIVYDDSHNTTADDIKAYFAAQSAAGTPIVICYETATPTTTTETVAISEPITNSIGSITISAENTMNVTYFQLEASNNKYQDIQIADNTLLTQFQQAWSNGDYITAFNIIDNNPQLDNKSFVADVINTLTANLAYLQTLNDPTFKADRIQTSSTPPVDLQVGQVYFKTL